MARRTGSSFSLQQLLVSGQLILWALGYAYLEASPWLRYGITLLALISALRYERGSREPIHATILLYLISGCGLLVLRQNISVAPAILLLGLSFWGAFWSLLPPPRPSVLAQIIFCSILCATILSLAPLAFSVGIQAVLVALLGGVILEKPVNKPSQTWQSIQVYAMLILLSSLLLALSTYLFR